MHLQGRRLVGHLLDQGETQLVFQVGLPELLVVIHVVLEFRVEQLLLEARITPTKLVWKLTSSGSLPSLQEETITLAF